MFALKLEVARFRSEDVIASSPVFLTAGQSYVTRLTEYQESGSVYNYSYDVVRFVYNPGEEDHMAVYGAGSFSTKALNKYVYAWYDGGRSAWVTEEKTKGEYGSSSELPE